MSARAAKLLLEVSDWIVVDPEQSSTGTMAIGTNLAGEILRWAKGYREHLEHVLERKEGEKKAQAKAADEAARIRLDEALALVRELAARKGADDLAREQAQAALDLLEGRR